MKLITAEAAAYFTGHSESMKKKRFIRNIGPKIATSKNAFSFLARL